MEAEEIYQRYIIDVNRIAHSWGRDVSKQAAQVAPSSRKASLARRQYTYRIRKRLAPREGKFTLRGSILPRYWRSFGAVDRIGISFQQWGMFLHYGFAGKSRIPAVNWLNPVIDANMKQLGDDIARATGEYTAEAVSRGI